MRIVLALFFLLGLVIYPACAQDEAQEGGYIAAVTDPQHHIATRELMNFCTGRYDVDYGFCAGYVTAVSEIMLDHTLYGYSACNHGPVKAQQLLENVGTFVRNDGGLDNRPGSVIVAAALANKFPCGSN